VKKELLRYFGIGTLKQPCKYCGMAICDEPILLLRSTDLVSLRSLVSFEMSNTKIGGNLKVSLDNQPE